MAGKVESLPERIERLIKEHVAAGRVKSVAQVLESAGASSGYLSERMSALKKTGAADIKMNMAIAIANVLGISLDELVGRESTSPAVRLDPASADTLSMAREAANSLARRFSLSMERAWFEFYELPVGHWTALQMFEWALGRTEVEPHKDGPNFRQHEGLPDTELAGTVAIESIENKRDKVRRKPPNLRRKRK